MLSKDEILIECRKIIAALTDSSETIGSAGDAALKLNKQARLAIELQAKLDKIRKWAGREVFPVCGKEGRGYMQAVDEIMALLGKRG